VKITITALLLVALLTLTATPVFANPDGGGVGDLYDRLDQGSIADQITPGQGANLDETEILQKIDERVSSVVATVRVLATIFAVIFMIWMGFIFFTAGGNPHKLADAKTQIIFFFVSMLFIFAAEPIVRFVMSWFLPDAMGS